MAHIVTMRDPALMSANVRWPRTGLEAKFSPWYTVASLIVDGGRLDLASFTDEAAMRPAVRDLLAKVNISQHRDYAGRPHRARGGGEHWEVTVRLKNGEQLVAAPVEGIGDTWGWESREAVFDKFRALAGTVLKPTRVEAAIAAFMDMDRATDLRKLVDTVMPER